MSTNKLEIKNFAFLDLETTGLPSHENNKTKVTELCITIIASEHLSLGTYPRVKNKLTLCFYPNKLIHPESTEITGLSNDILEKQPIFSINTVKIINEFLNLQNKPICLVAHNGNKFDYPILRTEIEKVNGDLDKNILCIDSLLCFVNLHKRKEVTKNTFRNNDSEYDSPQLKKSKMITTVPLDFSDNYDDILCAAVDKYEESLKKQNIQEINEETPKKQIYHFEPTEQKFKKNISTFEKRTSFKLCDIYKRLYSKDPIDSHEAEGDVDCLIHCAASFGEDFVQWANDNAKLFSDIPRMKPGTKIGF